MNDALEKAREAALAALSACAASHRDVMFDDQRYGEDGIAVAGFAYLDGEFDIGKMTRAALDAFLASLKEQGLVIVPVEFLKRMEWRTDSMWGDVECPICVADKNQGHFPGCQLAAMIAASPSQPSQPLQHGPSGKASEDG